MESDRRETQRTQRDVSAAHDFLWDDADDLLPESYRINSPDETRLLSIADNFQRQYSYLYPDRKPLLLCSVNESGVKKFVSTTVRPTPTPHPELFSWEGCASFVADFLTLDLLEPPTELPRCLFSPTSVLCSRRASCFEYATLLCSLLLGSHYDAYCVSGYAVKDVCLLDQSRQDCPLLDTQTDTEISEQQQENKYTAKPPGELMSRFVLEQEKKKQEAESVKENQEENNEQRPDDPLRGLRVHCWVLVLSGSRSIQENFFIDPLTGNSFSTTDHNFLGIESMWNNLNYYVNMQDCSKGCGDMLYDLEDLRMWEPLLFGATSKKQLIVDVLKKQKKNLTSKITKQEEDDEDEEPRVFEMPRSWVSYITVSKKELEARWPGGQKLIRYRKAKLERFELYLRSDGLITRLTTYKDPHCSALSSVNEWFQHRNDHLEQREVNEVDGFTTERFKRGRSFHLLCHRFGPQISEVEMEFSGGRVDSLVRRLLSAGEMTETFEGRSDFLYYRHVVFDRRVQFPAEDADPDALRIQKVVERFHRDGSKPAGKDVAERVFLISRRRIEVTYHLENHRFIPSKRSFIKPQDSTEQARAEDFTAAMVSSFQVDPSEEPLQTATLHQMLQDLVKDEETVILQIRGSKNEVRDILACRKQEEQQVHLLFSPWTTTGAARARKQKKDMERQAVEEQRWLQEKMRDNLAPFLIRLSNAETLSAEDAKQLHRDCLSECRQSLVDQANLIQERYEKETRELQKKQEWYQKNQINMSREEEKQYQSYCAEKTLQIHVAQKRLSMHKEAAPQKYLALDQRLKRDPRLAPHLLN